MSLDFLKNKTILITGGTGSFGKNFVSYLMQNSEAKKIIVFSRDEFKQFNMQKEIPDDGRLNFFLGDVRDLARLQRAFRTVDVVVHAAALKQVPTLEYNPFEAVKTNILGSQNVIDAAIDQGVGRVILISTDKAAHPVNLYGSTKLCAEKLFVAGNAYAGHATKFSVVRYGNVIGSRGSIVERILKQKDIKKVQLTDAEMSRFWITLDQSFKLVTFALANMEGGEIYIPKIPSMKVVDLFDTITPDAEKEITGIRPGEKLHETLLTKEEARHSVELADYYVVLSEFVYTSKDIYGKYFKMGQKVEPNFCFMSDTNKNWITKENIKNIIRAIEL